MDPSKAASLTFCSSKILVLSLLLKDHCFVEPVYEKTKMEQLAGRV